MDRIAELCLLLVLLLTLQVALSQVTHHVRPTLESPCFHEDCYTLSEIANNTDRYFHTNTTLVFLPGVHTLNMKVVIMENLENVIFVGHPLSTPNVTSIIMCNGSSAFIFKRVSRVRIQGLTFKYCGSTEFPTIPDVATTLRVLDGDNLPAITAQSVESFQLVDCRMENNYLALFSHRSSVNIHSTQFVRNTADYGGALQILDSRAVFSGTNLFHSNKAKHGGAIHAQNVEPLLFKGAVDFIDNKATKGGGIFADGSMVYLGDEMKNRSATQTSTSCFFHNSAALEGGGIRLLYSRMVQHYSHSIFFTENSVLIDGGAVWGEGSDIVLNGVSKFTSNSADVGAGGAVHLRQYSTWNSTIFIATYNIANTGGVLYSQDSTLYFQGDTTIMHNSALVPNMSAEMLTSIWTLSTSDDRLIIARRGAGGGLFTSDSKVLFYRDVTFLNNTATSEGGAMFVYSSKEVKFLTSSTATFINNSATDGGAILSEYSVLEFSSATTITGNSAWGGRGGGLCTVVDSKTYFLGETIITGNTAGMGGGIGASYYCLIEFNTTVDLSFSDNEAELNGGWLDLSRYSNLIITGNARFLNNRAGVAGGAISIWKLTSYVKLGGECLFLNNSAVFGGSIAIEQGRIDLLGYHVFESNSASYGGATYANSGEISLDGSYTFTSNTARHTGFGGYGGAIHALKTRIEVNGKVNFTSNSASYGGGLALANYEYVERRLLYLKPRSIVRFDNNYAHSQGGGIAIEDTSFLYCSSYSHETLNLRTPCFFQINEMECKPSSLERLTNASNDPGVYVLFEANIAEEGGNNIYGGILEKCGVCKDQTGKYMSGINVLSQIFEKYLQEKTGMPSNISSDPFRICICEDLQPDCSRDHISHRVFPGETIHIAAVAVGQMNGTSPAVVHARFSASEAGNLDHLQSTQTTGMNCTPLEYTLTKLHTSEAQLDIYAEGPCGELGYSVLITVYYLPCPHGFVLSMSGVCICEQRLQKYTNSCDINDRTITRNGDFWVGYDYQSRGLVLHPHCPFDYCTLEVVSFTLNSTDLQCAHGRSGILCGACKSGLSLNLGSSHCSSCSNAYVVLLLPFAAAGFLLVVLLFVIKLTVSAGTISGLTFFANVVAVNRSVFFPPGDTNVLMVFIAWLNLDLGIETCFFDGMDAYTRTWLQFVFPLYIWSLVGLITIVTHYSMTVARIIGPTNPVSVLATLFLLSYTKLLRTIIATFSFTTLDCPNDSSKLVWAHDGNVGYIEGKYIALFLAGLLAFLFLFLPYTVLLLCGQCFIAGSNHKLLRWVNKPVVKSFLDAYYAPYQDRHRYWVGLLLVLRFLLFIISAVIDINSPRDPSINLLVLAITCIGVTTFAWNAGSVYKKWYNNILESSFILNLAILAVASYQVKVEGGSQPAVIYTSVSVAFLTFLGVISYHVIERMRDSRVWRHTLKPRLYHIGERLSIRRQESQGPIEMEPPPVAPPPVVTTTFVELREPLLESRQ